MKKFKLSISLFALVLICILCHKFLLLLNYLFALALHELSHILVANKYGYKTKMVKLTMLGFSVELDAEIEPRHAFYVHIAGPVCNLMLSLICVGIYAIFPATYAILSTFCFTNLVLAFFNLLPVYPLDGGKIFSNIFKTQKAYRIADAVVRYSFAALFVVMFICSFKICANWLYILFAVFFILSQPNTAPNFSLFKPKTTNYEKAQLVKVNANTNLFDLLKMVNKHHYTIFYCGQNTAKFLDEDDIVRLALKYPLTTPIERLN